MLKNCQTLKTGGTSLSWREQGDARSRHEKARRFGRAVIANPYTTGHATLRTRLPGETHQIQLPALLEIDEGKKQEPDAIDGVTTVLARMRAEDAAAWIVQ